MNYYFELKNKKFKTLKILEIYPFGLFYLHQNFTVFFRRRFFYSEKSTISRNTFQSAGWYLT